MDKRRIEELQAQVYGFVFALLDGEPGIDGEWAGKVATAAAKEVRRVLLDPDDEGADMGELMA
jgi:hypothetical protein